MSAPPKDFREAINRSMASLPPGTSLTDWGRDTPEGRLVSAAKGMNDERLLVWVMAAPMGGDVRSAEHPPRLSRAVP